MNGKQATFFLTLSFLLVFIIGTPVFAQDADSDGDGVPDNIESVIAESLGIDTSELANLVSLPGLNGRYVILFVDRPDAAFQNVAVSDTPYRDGSPISSQATDAAPYGFFTFEVVGVDIEDVDEFNQIQVTLILFDYDETTEGLIQLVTFVSPSCPTNADLAEFDYPVTTPPPVPFPVGTSLQFPIVDPDLLDSDCEIEDAIPFTAAPAINGLLDLDEDGVFVFDDSCPADPNNDVDGDGVCGDVDNCPTIANGDQDDNDGDGIGDACGLQKKIAQTSVYSYIGKRFWRFFRDYDIWEIEGKAGQSLVVTVRAEPEKEGIGKRLNLILFGKTRGARLLRMDRSILDPQNMVEAVIPKDGIYCIIVSQPWWGRGKKFNRVYKLEFKGEPEMLESLRATRSVGKWWK